MTTLALVLTAGVVVVIGLGVSLAAFPAGAVSVASRLASVIALGCAAVTLVGTLLVLVHQFKVVPLLVLLALVTAASYVVAARRSSVAEHIAAVREELADDRIFLGLGLAVLVFVAVFWVAVPVQPLHGAWRYWSDGLELADRGAVPAFTAQWGAALPPDISKLGGSAFLGGLSFVFRDQPYAGMALALWLSVVGYAAGLLALGRELGLRRTAPALPLLGIAGSALPGGIALNEEIARKLAFFQNEDMGRTLALIAAVLIVAPGRERWRLERMVAGGAVLGAAALTHLIPAIAFVALIGGVLVAHLALGPERRRILWAVGALALAGVVTVIPLSVAGGDLGLQGAGSPTRYTLFQGKYDPTAKAKGLTRAPRLKSERRWYEPPFVTTRLAAEAAVGRGLTRTGVAFLAVLGLAAAATAFAFGTRELRFLVAGAAAVAVTILGIALLFSFRYTLYIPATFGKRRMFEYASIPPMLIGLAVLEVAAWHLVARWVNAGRAIVVAAVVALAAVAVGARGPAPKAPANSVDYVQAAVQTPCDSRLLVDRITRGTFQALSGRISVTEGLVPFLRPTIVNDVLELRASTERFFLDPSRSSSILSHEEIDFVVARISPALDAAPGLQRVAAVAGLGVYRVKVRSLGGLLPRPSESPGYHCFRKAPS
jgi:hypothetical protein